MPSEHLQQGAFGGVTAHRAITETREGAGPKAGLGDGGRTWMQGENADSAPGRSRRREQEVEMKSREPDEQVSAAHSRRDTLRAV